MEGKENGVLPLYTKKEKKKQSFEFIFSIGCLINGFTVTAFEIVWWRYI
jgi:hypothetical protein